MKLISLFTALSLLLCAATAQAALLYRVVGYGAYEGFSASWIIDKYVNTDPYGNVFYSLKYGASYTPAGGDYLFSGIEFANDRRGQEHPATVPLFSYNGPSFNIIVGRDHLTDVRGGETIYSNAYLPFGQPSYVLPSDAAGTLQIFQIDDVPEPASWVLMLAGFSLVGIAMRRAQRKEAVLS